MAGDDLELEKMGNHGIVYDEELEQIERDGGSKAYHHIVDLKNAQHCGCTTPYGMTFRSLGPG